jgi:hypothetical protein
MHACFSGFEIYLTISAFAFLTPILVIVILTWSRGFARARTDGETS